MKKKRQKKNTIKKRYLIPLLCLGLLLIALIPAVFAAGETFTDSTSGLTYRILSDPDVDGNGGTVEITGIAEEKATGSLVISNTVTYQKSESDAPQEYTITAIGKSTDLAGKGAFEDCTALTSISLPDTLTKIEENAFAGCILLTAINGLSENPDVEIAEGAFSGCAYLDDAGLPSDTDKNPNPFGNDVLSFYLESRGTSAPLTPIVNGIAEDAGTDIPLRVFKGQEYQISAETMPADYKLVGLALSEDAPEQIAEPYEIGAEFTATSTAPPTYTFTVPQSGNGNALTLFVIATKNDQTTGAPTITTASPLEAGKVSESYAKSLTAAPADGVIWTLENTSGTADLPDGLQFEESTAMLSGTPTAPGTYTFTIRAANEVSYHDKEFTLLISDENGSGGGDDTAEQLASPSNLKWDDSLLDNIKASWDPVDQAESYLVQLYLEDKATGEAVSVTGPVLSYDFTDAIQTAGAGTYTFTVIAQTSDTSYTDSAAATSPTYLYTVAGISSYTITASAGAGGTISPSGEVSVTEGGDQSFTIKADKGYEISTVTVDGTDVGKQKSYAFSNVTGNHTILAEFRLVSNRIDGVASSYEKGKTVAFTALGDGMDATAPKDGDTRWLPSTWQLDEDTAQSWSEAPYTGEISTSNLSAGTHSLQITFQQQRYDGQTGTWSDETDAEDPTSVIDTRSVSFQVTAAAAENTENTDSNSTDNTGNTDASDATDGTSASGSDSTSATGSDGTSSSNQSAGSGSGGSSGNSGGIISQISSVISNPQTGDGIRPGFWIGLCLLAAAGLLICVVRSRKRT